MNGGWAASDEACPTYEELIQNIMAGHAFLKKTFGITPKHAWHLDAFGHSASTPELFSRMGFETITFARMNDEERNYRFKQKTLQFNWSPEFEGTNSSVQSKGSIFTNMLHKHYEPPCGLHVNTWGSGKVVLE